VDVTCARNAEGTYEIAVTVWDSDGTEQVQTLAGSVRRLVAQDGEVFFSSSSVMRIGGTSVDHEIPVNPNGCGKPVWIGRRTRRPAKDSSMKCWTRAG